MGTTLTHNVYLPAEGERNCYSGLAQNWQILDDAVGAIAGKANASHTHGNITNAGAIGSTSGLPIITGTDGVLTTGTFGNTAGTFCEGNDSRLSDARTPVAHTHSKSDVTDLLNSNFIPSANNSYDLGSSSYQWNNLYAKNYYYNGTQWGLDQANTWTNTNTFSSGISMDGNVLFAWDRPQITVGTTPPGIVYYAGTRVRDSLTNSIALFRGLVTESSDNYYDMYLFNFNDVSSWSRLRMYISANGTLSQAKFSFTEVIPEVTNATDLGTSSNKWKTLNGVNPGALSLPGGYSSSVTEYITDKTGGNNTYTAPADGWVGIQANSATLDSTNFIFMGRTSDGSNYYAQNASSPINGYWSNLYHGCILLPVISGKTYGIRCKCDSVDARFYTANGNVS